MKKFTPKLEKELRKKCKKAKIKVKDLREKPFTAYDLLRHLSIHK